MRLSVSDKGVVDQFDDPRWSLFKLLGQRAEEHVLGGGRNGDQVSSELRMQLEREGPLEEHVGPPGVLEGRHKRARDHEVGDEVADERPPQVVRACVEKRGGCDKVAQRRQHGVRRPRLLGDSLPEGRGFGFVA